MRAGSENLMKFGLLRALFCFKNRYERAENERNNPVKFTILTTGF